MVVGIRAGLLAASAMLVLGSGVGARAATPVTGIALDVADWLTGWDSAHGGGWGVAPAGTTPGKWISFTTETSAAVPPGSYDVYWVQDGEHPPLEIAAGVSVLDGALASVNVNSGIELALADWVPPRDPETGYWGVFRADAAAGLAANWLATDTPMMVPAGDYLLVWRADDSRDQGIVILGRVTIDEPFSGIGAAVDAEANRLTVIYPVPGGAADRAGILPGDVILTADGVPLDGDTDEGVALLRGPAGTSINLVVSRPGATAPLTFSLVRDAVDMDVVVDMDSGIRLNVDPRVPAMTDTGAWWVVLAGDAPSVVAARATSADTPILLAPIPYDVYWQPDAGTAPRLIAAAVTPDHTLLTVDVGLSSPAAPADQAVAKSLGSHN